jgi:hypothetical protein
MTRSRLFPRPDQVAELTRGLRLPLPGLADAHLDVIFESILCSWRQLVEHHGHELLNKDENELNSLLQIHLNGSRLHNDLLAQMVACVVRGGESVSFDGTHIEKRPDLAFYLTGRHASFPLLMECKIIDQSSGRSIDLYCAQGLRRFVDGEYAWGNMETVMVAYVHDRSSIEENLIPHLVGLAANPPDTMRTVSMPQRRPSIRSPTSVSQHDRVFRYVNSSGNNEPGVISIWHLWMNAPIANSLG